MALVNYLTGFTGTKILSVIPTTDGKFDVTIFNQYQFRENTYVELHSPDLINLGNLFPPEYRGRINIISATINEAEIRRASQFKASTWNSCVFSETDTGYVPAIYSDKNSKTKILTQYKTDVDGSVENLRTIATQQPNNITARDNLTRALANQKQIDDQIVRLNNMPTTTLPPPPPVPPRLQTNITSPPPNITAQSTLAALKEQEAQLDVEIARLGRLPVSAENNASLAQANSNSIFIKERIAAFNNLPGTSTATV